MAQKLIEHRLQRRQGEIALQLIKHRLRKTLQGAMREFGNVAKEAGIPVDELKQFVGPIVHEALDDVLAVKK